MSIAEIKAEIPRMTPEEKAELALALFADAGAPPAPDAEIERAWDEEIARRADTVRSGAAKGVDAGEVFAELDRRLPS